MKCSVMCLCLLTWVLLACADAAANVNGVVIVMSEKYIDSAFQAVAVRLPSVVDTMHFSDYFDEDSWCRKKQYYIYASKADVRSELVAGTIGAHVSSNGIYFEGAMMVDVLVPVRADVLWHYVNHHCGSKCVCESKDARFLVKVQFFADISTVISPSGALSVVCEKCVSVEVQLVDFHTGCSQILQSLYDTFYGDLGKAIENAVSSKIVGFTEQISESYRVQQHFPVSTNVFMAYNVTRLEVFPFNNITAFLAVNVSYIGLDDPTALHYVVIEDEQEALLFPPADADPIDPLCQETLVVVDVSSTVVGMILNAIVKQGFLNSVTETSVLDANVNLTLIMADTATRVPADGVLSLEITAGQSILTCASSRDHGPAHALFEAHMANVVFNGRMIATAERLSYQISLVDTSSATVVIDLPKLFDDPTASHQLIGQSLTKSLDLFNTLLNRSSFHYPSSLTVLFPSPYAYVVQQPGCCNDQHGYVKIISVRDAYCTGGPAHGIDKRIPGHSGVDETIPFLASPIADAFLTLRFQPPSGAVHMYDSVNHGDVPTLYSVAVFGSISGAENRMCDLSAPGSAVDIVLIADSLGDCILMPDVQSSVPGQQWWYSSTFEASSPFVHLFCATSSCDKCLAQTDSLHFFDGSQVSCMEADARSVMIERPINSSNVRGDDECTQSLMRSVLASIPSSAVVLITGPTLDGAVLSFAVLESHVECASFDDLLKRFASPGIFYTVSLDKSTVSVVCSAGCEPSTCGFVNVPVDGSEFFPHDSRNRNRTSRLLTGRQIAPVSCGTATDASNVSEKSVQLVSYLIFAGCVMIAFTLIAIVSICFYRRRDRMARIQSGASGKTALRRLREVKPRTRRVALSFLVSVADRFQLWPLPFAVDSRIVLSKVMLAFVGHLVISVLLMIVGFKMQKWMPVGVVDSLLAAIRAPASPAVDGNAHLSSSGVFVLDKLHTSGEAWTVCWKTLAICVSSVGVCLLFSWLFQRLHPRGNVGYESLPQSLRRGARLALFATCFGVGAVLSFPLMLHHFRDSVSIDTSVIGVWLNKVPELKQDLNDVIGNIATALLYSVCSIDVFFFLKGIDMGTYIAGIVSISVMFFDRKQFAGGLDPTVDQQADRAGTSCLIGWTVFLMRSAGAVSGILASVLAYQISDSKVISIICLLCMFMCSFVSIAWCHTTIVGVNRLMKEANFAVAHLETAADSSRHLIHGHVVKRVRSTGFRFVTGSLILWMVETAATLTFGLTLDTSPDHFPMSLPLIVYMCGLIISVSVLLLKRKPVALDVSDSGSFSLLRWGTIFTGNSTTSDERPEDEDRHETVFHSDTSDLVPAFGLIGQRFRGLWYGAVGDRWSSASARPSSGDQEAVTSPVDHRVNIFQKSYVQSGNLLVGTILLSVFLFEYEYSNTVDNNVEQTIADWVNAHWSPITYPSGGTFMSPAFHAFDRGLRQKFAVQCASCALFFSAAGFDVVHRILLRTRRLRYVNVVSSLGTSSMFLACLAAFFSMTPVWAPAYADLIGLSSTCHYCYAQGIDSVIRTYVGGIFGFILDLLFVDVLGYLPICFATCLPRVGARLLGKVHSSPLPPNADRQQRLLYRARVNVYRLMYVGGVALFPIIVFQSLAIMFQFALPSEATLPVILLLFVPLVIGIVGAYTDIPFVMYLLWIASIAAFGTWIIFVSGLENMVENILSDTETWIFGIAEILLANAVVGDAAETYAWVLGA